MPESKNGVWTPTGTALAKISPLPIFSITRVVGVLSDDTRVIGC